LLNSDRSLEDSLFFIACQIQKLIDACQIIIFSIIDGKFIRFCVQCRKGQERSANFLNKSVYQLHPSPQDAQWLVELAMAGKPYSTANFQTDVHLSPEMGRCLDREVHAMSFIPILQGGEVFGGLVVLFRKARLPAHYETYLFELFADQAALAIGNSNLRTRVEDLAVMAERNRLARDLHDAVTQTLFSASLIAEALPSTWEGNKREGRKLLGELRQLTRGALAEMRSLLMELRPRSVADARLVDLLHQLAEATIGRTGMNVSVTAPADLPLPQDVHLGLYRIAQEALANTIRHARARKTQLILEEELMPGEVAGLGDRVHVVLCIRDNGRGFVVADVPSDHFGLRNMRERAQAIGADIRIESFPKKGTTIRIEWTGEVRTDE
jgi:signal transduction histidine kinase